MIIMRIRWPGSINARQLSNFQPTAQNAFWCKQRETTKHQVRATSRLSLATLEFQIVERGTVISI